MENNYKLAAILFATIIGLGTVGIVSAEHPYSEHTVSGDERAWVKQLELRGVDPTAYPGYDCSHGHRSFGC